MPVRYALVTPTASRSDGEGAPTDVLMGGSSGLRADRGIRARTERRFGEPRRVAVLIAYLHGGPP